MAQFLFSDKFDNGRQYIYLVSKNAQKPSISSSAIKKCPTFWLSIFLFIKHFWVYCLLRSCSLSNISAKAFSLASLFACDASGARAFLINACHAPG